MSISTILVLFGLLGLSHGHSMMTCAVLQGNTCVGAVRNAPASLQTTNYKFDGTNPCQPEARGVTNLDSKYTCQGCGPMGQLSAGSTFTVQWKARNHAVANQNPRTVKVYLSPNPVQTGQTADFTFAQFQTNLICEGPFINCGNGPNVDTLGDDVSCTLGCTVPINAYSGTYSLLWFWDWTQNDGNKYMTCADIKVVGAANPPTQQTSLQQTTQGQQTQTTQRQQTSQATQQQTTQQQQTSLQQTTQGQQTQTTQRQQTSQATQQQTTQQQQTSQGQTESMSTSNTPCGDPTYCTTVCGEGRVASCSCVNGVMSAICSDANGILPAFFLLIALVLCFMN